MLGEDTEISLYVHEGDCEAFKKGNKRCGWSSDFLSGISKRNHSKQSSLERNFYRATGYNFVDADAAEKQNTAVAVIGEYCTQEVADHTMA